MTNFLFIFMLIILLQMLVITLVKLREHADDSIGSYRDWDRKPTNYSPHTMGYHNAPHSAEELRQ